VEEEGKMKDSGTVQIRWKREGKREISRRRKRIRVVVVAVVLLVLVPGLALVWAVGLFRGEACFGGIVEMDEGAG
jgi:hypothetical protein